MGAQPGESTNAAVTLLHHGFIGNPYLVPTGPSAHVSPLLAVYLAAVYAVFGVNTWIANVALGIIAAAIYAAAAAVTLRSLDFARVSASGNWVAIGVLLSTSSLILFYVVAYCRDWEEPVSALVLVYGWQVFIRFERQGARASLILMMAGLAGVSFLLTPAITPSLIAGLILMMWRDRRARGSRRRAIGAVLIVVALALPWGIRNRMELGSFILTRSNFGLELAQGNQPGAQGPSSVGWTAPIHPSISMAAARSLRRVGEVRYMANTTALAIHWIRADPIRFLSLTAIRAWLVLIPDRDLIGWYPVVGSTGALLILSVFGALKVLALAASLVAMVRPLQCVLFCLLPLAPYVVTHVYMRYEIPTYFTTVLMLTIVADAMLTRLNARRRLAPIPVRSRSRPPAPRPPPARAAPAPRTRAAASR